MESLALLQAIIGVVIEAAYPKMIILDWLLPYLIQLPRSRVVLHVEIAHPSPIPTLSSEPSPIFLNVEDFVQATHLGFVGFIHLKTMCTRT